MREYPVCAAAELPESDVRLVQVDGREVGVFRVEGRLYAFENRCLHQGGPVCLGEVMGKVELELADDRTVVRERVSEREVHLVCPWHGWEYDIETGGCAADRKLKLRRFETLVRDGRILVLA